MDIVIGPIGGSEPEFVNTLELKTMPVDVSTPLSLVAVTALAN